MQAGSGQTESRALHSDMLHLTCFPGDLHDMTRALQEAIDMNVNANGAPGARLDSRTASFCLEASGHDDLWADKHGDQGETWVSRRGRLPGAGRALITVLLVVTSGDSANHYAYVDFPYSGLIFFGPNQTWVCSSERERRREADRRKVKPRRKTLIFLNIAPSLF